jgi:Na+/proline symporter
MKMHRLTAFHSLGIQTVLTAASVLLLLQIDQKHIDWLTWGVFTLLLLIAQNIAPRLFGHRVKAVRKPRLEAIGTALLFATAFVAGLEQYDNVVQAAVGFTLALALNVFSMSTGKPYAYYPVTEKH